MAVQVWVFRKAVANGHSARAEAKISTDGENYYVTDLPHRFIWWRRKDDVMRLADQVQRIQIRRIERDMFETEELVRRCLRLLSGGDNGGDEEGSGGSGSDSGGGGGGGGMRKRRSAGGGGDGGRGSRSISVPAVSRARSTSGREVETEERVSEKVKGDTTDSPPMRRERDRDRGSRYEVRRPDRDASGRMVVDVRGPVDIERPRNRDRDRDRDIDRPAPVYVEREKSRYGDRGSDTYR